MSLTFNSMNDFYVSDNSSKIICPICGKEFKPAPEHIYYIGKSRSNFVCSWSCMRKWEKSDVEERKAAQKAKPKPEPKGYKIVRVVETGEIFYGAKECALHLNVALSGVYKALQKGATCHGFHIEAVKEGDTE